jgi:Nodulation protein Z (NodZ)
LCFRSPPILAGVPFIGDDTVARVRLPKPRYPPIWENEMLVRFPFLRPSATLLADRDAAVALIRAGDDMAAPTVIFDACVNDGIVSLTEARSFLGALCPLPHLAAHVAAFRETHLRPGPAIGLHVRHGNGVTTGHAGYWESFPSWRRSARRLSPRRRSRERRRGRSADGARPAPDGAALPREGAPVAIEAD